MDTTPLLPKCPTSFSETCNILSCQNTNNTIKDEDDNCNECADLLCCPINLLIFMLLSPFVCANICHSTLKDCECHCNCCHSNETTTEKNVTVVTEKEHSPTDVKLEQQIVNSQPEMASNHPITNLVSTIENWEEPEHTIAGQDNM